MIDIIIVPGMLDRGHNKIFVMLMNIKHFFTGKIEGKIHMLQKKNLMTGLLMLGFAGGLCGMEKKEQKENAEQINTINDVIDGINANIKNEGEKEHSNAKAITDPFRNSAVIKACGSKAGIALAALAQASFQEELSGVLEQSQNKTYIIPNKLENWGKLQPYCKNLWFNEKRTLGQRIRKNLFTTCKLIAGGFLGSIVGKKMTPDDMHPMDKALMGPIGGLGGLVLSGLLLLEADHNPRNWIYGYETCGVQRCMALALGYELDDWKQDGYISGVLHKRNMNIDMKLPLFKLVAFKHKNQPKAVSKFSQWYQYLFGPSTRGFKMALEVTDTEIAEKLLEKENNPLSNIQKLGHITVNKTETELQDYEIVK